MNKQLIHTQIANLLETIIDQQEIIASCEDTIPQIELDIVLSNIRKLYELYRTLEKSSGHPPSARRIARKQTKPNLPGLFEDLFAETPEQVRLPERVEEKSIENKPEEHRAPVTVPEIAKVEDVSFQKEEIIAVLEEESNEESQMEAVVEDVPAMHAVTDEQLEEQPEETPSFEETEQEELAVQADIRETLHDRLLQTADEDILANKLKKQPIADLRNAIGINEKFLFINEIFNADAAAYSNSIDFINQCKSHAEAKVYVETILKPRFSWSLDNKRVIDFLELVERRFL